MLLTPAQLRAARGLLDWTRADLAKAAQLSPETIKNIEHGTFKPQDATAAAIVRAFALHDVDFTEEEGVRKRRDQVKTFSGRNGFQTFLDDIYNTIKDNGGEICQCNFSDDLFVSFAGDYGKQHAERIAKLKNIQVKCLTFSGDTNFVSETYCEYRWLPKSHDLTVPYYLYGDCVALMVSQKDASVDFVVVKSDLLTNRYRQHFESLWRLAQVPSVRKEKK